MDCIVNGVAKELDITEQLSHTHVEYGSGGLKKGRTTELHLVFFIFSNDIGIIILKLCIYM